MKVALVDPPILGHARRGTGVYAESLLKNLKKIGEVDISLVTIKDNLEKFNAVHFPYFDPFFLTLPIFRRYRNVVTVHDLIPIAFPEHFAVGFKGTIKWQIQKFSLEKSQAIITDSIVSKEDITKYTNIKPEKIHVIPLGVRDDIKIIKDKKLLNRVKNKFKLPDNFILHVGDVNYNKNIKGLIQAFSNIVRSNKNIYLVLVGKGFNTDTIQLREINDLIDKLQLQDKVIKIGFVAIDELVALYNLAKVYVQPSFAEGFGLPVLEAMACGCSCIVSNLSSLPELVGDAAILIDPYSVEDIQSGILEILNKPQRKEEIIKKGLERVKKFSWQKCAQETLEVYKCLISNET